MFDHAWPFRGDHHAILGRRYARLARTLEREADIGGRQLSYDQTCGIAVNGPTCGVWCGSTACIAGTAFLLFLEEQPRAIQDLYGAKIRGCGTVPWVTIRDGALAFLKLTPEVAPEDAPVEERALAEHYGHPLFSCDLTREILGRQPTPVEAGEAVRRVFRGQHPWRGLIAA